MTQVDFLCSGITGSKGFDLCNFGQIKKNKESSDFTRTVLPFMLLLRGIGESPEALNQRL